MPVRVFFWVDPREELLNILSSPPFLCLFSLYMLLLPSPLLLLANSLLQSLRKGVHLQQNNVKDKTQSASVKGAE